MILVGFTLSLFFSVLLLAKKNKSKADYFLFAWLLFISVHILFFWANFTDLFKKYPHLIGIDLPFPIFHALFLFFYVRLLSCNKNQFKPSDLLHLIPSLVAYIYMIPFFLKDKEEKYHYFKNIRVNEKYFLNLFTCYTIVFGLIYAYLSYKMTVRHKKYIDDQFSYHEKINLNWLKKLIPAMTILWLIVIFSKIFFSASISDTGDYIIYSSVTLFVFFLGHYGIRQTTVFSEVKLEDTTYEQPGFPPKTRYKKSGLKKEQVLIIKEKLNYLMDTEKIFLNNELTLDILAKEIGISPNYLSQVINEYFSKNFYDFINFYRIEDFKKKTTDSKFKDYSILAIAYECGFNSKSAFYNVFKKEVGVKPGEYLKKVNK